MKHLYIVRHAKANFGDPRYEDFENPLTEEGEEQAREAGERLGLEGVKPDVILTSTAKRAITTARLLSEGMGLGSEVVVEVDKLYNAPEEVILDVVRAQGKGDVVMVVAHNPGISGFSSRVLGQAGVSLGTCQILPVPLSIESWIELDWV